MRIGGRKKVESIMLLVGALAKVSWAPDFTLIVMVSSYINVNIKGGLMALGNTTIPLLLLQPLTGMAFCYN